MTKHYHCPHDCEHPQPFDNVDGRKLCGRCFFVEGVETEMILCTPDVCPDDPGLGGPDIEPGYSELEGEAEISAAMFERPGLSNETLAAYSRAKPHRLRSQFILGIAPVKLAPGEERELSVTTSQSFIGERLVVPRAPDPKWWRLKRALGAIIHNIVFSPLIFFGGLQDGMWMWMPLYMPAPDDRMLIDIKVGGVSQFVVKEEGEIGPVATGVSMACFDPASFSFNLSFDRAEAGVPISLVVRNVGRSEQPFAAAIVGTTEVAA